MRVRSVDRLAPHVQRPSSQRPQVRLRPVDLCCMSSPFSAKQKSLKHIFKKREICIPSWPLKNLTYVVLQVKAGRIIWTFQVCRPPLRVLASKLNCTKINSCSAESLLGPGLYSFSHQHHSLQMIQPYYNGLVSRRGCILSLGETSAGVNTESRSSSCFLSLN